MRGLNASAASTSASASEAKSVFPTRERLEAQAALRLEADEIALAAAHEGRFDGFDGAVLEVSWTRRERERKEILVFSTTEKKPN